MFFVHAKITCFVYHKAAILQMDNSLMALLAQTHARSNYLITNGQSLLVDRKRTFDSIPIVRIDNLFLAYLRHTKSNYLLQEQKDCIYWSRTNDAARANGKIGRLILTNRNDKSVHIKNFIKRAIRMLAKVYVLKDE